MTHAHLRCVPVLLAALALPSGVATLRAQAPQSAGLAGVERLECAFTLMVIGAWDKEVPSAETSKSTLVMHFDAINTDEGTANVVSVSSASEGAPHLTARLLGENLHLLAMNISGSVYLTTVFADKESRTSGRYKAVHTRHEFTPVKLTGWTSRPEQYYGHCEVAK